MYAVFFTEEGFSVLFVYLEHGISLARFFLALLSAQGFRLLETANFSKSSKSAMSKSPDHPPPARQTQSMNPPRSTIFHRSDAAETHQSKRWACS